MAFDHIDAPTTFMRLINDIFKRHMGFIVAIYLDEILIFRKSQDTHLQHVRQVLQILGEHKL